MVNAHPAGTTFCLRAGIHYRTSAITPKTGNVFVGEYGAVIDGSKWSTTDEWQALFRAHNQNIDNVVIRNLVIRNSPQRGIHGLYNYSDGWLIEHNEISGNRQGLSHPNYSVVRRNIIRENWQYGIGSYRTTGSVIEDNEFSGNAARRAEYPGAAGTSKWAQVTNTTVRGNLLQDNHWHGIWFDGFHSGIVIENNVVRRNPENGIFHEIGGATVIRGNTISGVTRGIFISASHDSEVYGNLVFNSERAIMLFQDGNRVSQSDLYNNLIRDNTFRVPSTISSAQAVSMWCSNLTATQCAAYSTSKGNRFRGNAYYVSDTTKRWWYWSNASKTWTEWQAAGQDSTGSLQKL